MKMVKSLLLGSAAGLVAVAGAQAADLPVKAKPVEYVKVCSLYGAGYYYVPGSDMCLKVGGYVRAEWTYGYGSSISNGPWTDTSTLHTRDGGTADTVWRTRAYVTLDSRQQTAYGTLRAFYAVGHSGDQSPSFSSNRAFIQIAGFTVGLATSYFDFFAGAATSYFTPFSSDTGDGGMEVFAYTAQLGNGVSASLSLENPNRRRINVIRQDSIAHGTSPFTITSRYAKLIAPDIVGNLRISQAWGGAQVMGALHQVSGSYYGANQNTGHPSDEWGWAAAAGLRINFPMVAPGDYFQAQVAYTQGALRYIANSGAAAAGQANSEWNGGSSIGMGIWSDGVFSNSIAGLAQDIQLTTGWGVAGAYEHFWTPSLRSSVYGGYVKVEYNATANRILCEALAGTISPSSGGAMGTNTGCNNNFAMWNVGSRTQWNVTKSFYMGFDVVYAKMETAHAGLVATVTGTGSQPTAVRTFEDQDYVAARVRWHRDIEP